MSQGKKGKQIPVLFQKTLKIRHRALFPYQQDHSFLCQECLMLSFYDGTIKIQWKCNDKGTTMRL